MFCDYIIIFIIQWDFGFYVGATGHSYSFLPRFGNEFLSSNRLRFKYCYHYIVGSDIVVIFECACLLRIVPDCQLSPFSLYVLLSICLNFNNFRSSQFFFIVFDLWIFSFNNRKSYRYITQVNIFFIVPI